MFFKCTTVFDMGLIIYLGHMGCLMPRDGPTSFTIIHTNGIHHIHIVFCSCAISVHPQQQLLCHAWFPATIHQPQTCAMFAVLNHFHLQTLHSKLTATHFISAIEHETDNTGLVPVKVCRHLNTKFIHHANFLYSPQNQYISFLCMSCEWCHLQMLKRAGWGHDDSGASGTQPGGLAVACPACPHPGINLPDDWEIAPPSKQYDLQFASWHR
jgi:CxC2 like cysteine cluster associated with KDZ transposases